MSRLTVGELREALGVRSVSVWPEWASPHRPTLRNWRHDGNRDQIGGCGDAYRQLSQRQVGPAGVIHANRGRASPRYLPDGSRKRGRAAAVNREPPRCPPSAGRCVPVEQRGLHDMTDSFAALHVSLLDV